MGAPIELRFADFEVSPRSGELRRNGLRVKLQEQPFQILVLLLERGGDVVSRDEIRQKLWTADTFVDFDNGLNIAVKKLRTALGDNADAPRYIETLPRRGYRFIAPVTAYEFSAQGSGDTFDAILPDAPMGPESATASVGSSLGPILLAESDTREPSVLIGPPPSRVAPTSPVPSRRAWPATRKLIAIAAAVAILATVIGAVFYRRTNAAPKLTDKDTIVLADFDNKTADPVFDDTLKTGLTVALDQSPFLNVLSDKKLAQTLKLMTRPSDTKLTPEVAADLCQRAGAKAYIAGTIARLGSEYVLALKAINCQSGDTLAEEQVTANGKEKVLNTLGDAAAKLRGQLGESLATIQKFDTPLQQATTSSLEALQAYSLGTKTTLTNPSDRLPYFQLAIQLDPNFASAYRSLGSSYSSLHEPTRAGEYFTKAFELREHVSEREKLDIATTYYWNVTGELHKAAQADLELMQSYPENARLYNALGEIYEALGEYEKAVRAFQESLRVERDWYGVYSPLALALVTVQRFDEARQVLNQANALKFDTRQLHMAAYLLAFLTGDSVAQREQQLWFLKNPDFAHEGFSFASDTEAFGGHLVKARELTKRSVEAALGARRKENGAVWQENAAIREAAVGNFQRALPEAGAGVKLDPDSRAVVVEAALAYAMAGDSDRAQSLAHELNRLYPLDDQVQSIWLPAIRAQIALNLKDPDKALDALGAPSQIESGNIEVLFAFNCMYNAYIRGGAYLAAGNGSAAAAEFQRISEHSGLVVNCWTGALAHLQLARAQAMMGDAEAARRSYQDFLTLWKDADPDIPIYRQAKAEYTKLR